MLVMLTCVPQESAEGKINDAFPGYLLGFVVDEPTDETKDTVDQAAGTSDGVSTNAIIGIVGGVVVLALVGVIAMLLRKPKSKDNNWEKEPTDFNLPSPSEVLEKEDAGPSPTLEALPGMTPSHTESTASAVTNSEQATIANKVDSWESLPPGNYLDPDERYFMVQRRRVITGIKTPMSLGQSGNLEVNYEHSSSFRD